MLLNTALPSYFAIIMLLYWLNGRQVEMLSFIEQINILPLCIIKIVASLLPYQLLSQARIMAFFNEFYTLDLLLSSSRPFIKEQEDCKIFNILRFLHDYHFSLI